MTESIKHFGILGMKWGVRKDRTPSSDHRSAIGSVKGKKGKQLSDEELKKAIARLRLEKDYNSLNKSQLTKGSEVVGKLLGGVLKTTVALGLSKVIYSSVKVAYEMYVLKK